MTIWTRKIQAFLCNPPDRALDVIEASSSSRASKLLEQVLRNGSAKEVKQANLWACGLDVPPFVRDLDMPEKLLLKHPLSGEEKEIASLSSINKNSIAEVVQTAVREIHRAYNSDERKLFLALWRLLPEVIRTKGEKLPLRDYWELMPYDPRVPDHSIWDHQALTSALATTASADGAPKPALLIFGLGSVQEFLSTARRTQDLWMGSFLLSYLLWEAIKPLADAYGPDCVIYPNLRGQPLVDHWLREDIGLKNGDVQVCKPESDALKIANFPNIFTAIVPQDKVRGIADECTKAMREQWCKISACVRDVIQAIYDSERKFDLLNDESWKQAWHMQIPDLIDRLGIFWVAYPWEENPQTILTGDHAQLIGGAGDDESIYELIKHWLNVIGTKDQNGGMAYPLVSALTARFYSSRKNLRDLHQTEEPGEKCSQCGVREALHPTETEYHARTKDGSCKIDPGVLENEKLDDKVHPQKLLGIFWKDLAKIGERDKVRITIDGQQYEVKLAGRIRRGDRLCAICLTKRLCWDYFFIDLFFEKGSKEAETKEAHLMFPSTSTMAAASFKSKILKKLQEPEDSDGEKLVDALKDYVKKMKKLLQPSSEAYSDLLYWSPPIPNLQREKEAVMGSKKTSLSDHELETFLRLDGEWLSKDSFTAKGIAYEYEIDDLKINADEKINADDMRNAIEALNKLLEVTDDLEIPRPCKYYALLYFDGDKVSRWVSGEKAPKFKEILHRDTERELQSRPDIQALLDQKRPLGPASHVAISAAMKHFALDVVRSIVEDHHCGKLIYAGGDDVLAFMPVDELIPIMRELRQLFSGTGKANGLDQDGYVKRQDGVWIMSMGNCATASAGVVIAHHTHPFSQVAEEATTALKKHAKNKAKVNRNGFAIHLYKRSGAPREIGAKWFYDTLDTLDVLQQLTKLIQDDRFSAKLAYQMADEALGLAGLEGAIGLEAKTAELKRLIGRHIRVKVDQLQPAERACLFDHLPSLIVKFNGEIHGKREVPWGGESDWSRVADLILLARFLAEEAQHG
jgi:CRISPR-associated protein Cmr2